MIGALLRRDLSILIAPFLWACGIIFGYIMAQAASIDFARGTGPNSLDPTRTHFAWALWLLLIAVFNYFGGGRMWEIATPMHLSLPVRAWDLWKARMLSMQLAITGGALFACAAFWYWYEPGLQPVQVALGFNVVCLILLAPFLYHSVRLRTYKWGMPLGIYVPLLVAIVWIGSRIGLKTVWPGVLSLLLSIAIVAMVYRRLPLSYELPIRGEGAWGVLGKMGEATVAWLERLPLLGTWMQTDRLLRPGRMLSKPQLSFVLSLAVVINIFLLSLSAYGLLLVLVALHAAWFLRCLNGLSGVAYLPIARQRLFWHAMLPGYLLLALAAWISVAVLPSVGVGGGPSASSVVAGVAYYVVTWWLILSISIAPYGTPPATLRGWRTRYLLSSRLWIGLVLVVVPFLLHMFTAMARSEVMARPFPGPLADALPLDAAAYWVLVAILLVVTQLDLHKQFLNVELASVRKGAESA